MKPKKTLIVLTVGALTATAFLASATGAAATTAAQLSIGPLAHSFGHVALGATSSTQTFTVKNAGGTVSGKPRVNLIGRHATEYAIVANTCTAPIPAHGSCSVNVTFTPSATGVTRAGLKVTALPGGSVTAVLRGVGVTPAHLTISPDDYTFGPVAVGDSSFDEIFIVTNVGQQSVGPLTAVLGGANAGDMVLDVTTCNEVLAYNEACYLDVRFAPFAPGARIATLTASAADGLSATATLHGTGT